MTPEEERAIFEMGKMYGALDGKLESLIASKWTTLAAARAHVTEWLLGRPPSTDEEWQDTFLVNGLRPSPSTEYGRRYDLSERSGESFLIRLLASGDLRARGILHGSTDSTEMAMHEPMQLIWWRRFGNPGDGFPFHALLWAEGIAIRCRPDSGASEGGLGKDSILATITDIEVDRLRLLEIVKSDDPDKAALPKRSRPGPRPDEARIAAVADAAKKVIGRKFRSVEDFAKAVADEYSTKDRDGIDPKQVRRWIFREP